MSQCHRCALGDDCQYCAQLGGHEKVRCRELYRQCGDCSESFCTVHLLNLKHEALHAKNVDTGFYCHGCAEKRWPNSRCQRFTERNYTEKVACGGCTNEFECEICAVDPSVTPLCFRSETSHFPTTKCHDCTRSFCDHHLDAGTHSEALLLEHLDKNVPIPLRCHGCSVRFAKRAHICARCNIFSLEQLKRCARCRNRYYCGSVCQTADWSDGHSQVCVAKTGNK
jgi:MYND finger